jgi:hypothetical protein
MSRLTKIGVSVVILAVLLGLRLWDLKADPPQNLSESTSIYTDHSQYTLYARYFVERGELNPYEDYRQPFFVKSTVTALAIAVFEIARTGLWQSNLVGVLYSVGALVLFFLFIGRLAGWWAAWLFALMAGLNYNLFFFGRLPFLEHAMCFWAFLALVLLSYVPTRIGYLLAGLSLGLGVFFSKVIGLIFLFPFACWLLYRWRFEETTSGRDRYRKPLMFAVGFGLLTFIWVYFSYLETPEQVTGYIGEQAYDLYGAPDAFRSVGEFFSQFASFGTDSHLFERMVVPGLLGIVLLLIALYRMARGRSWREGFGGFSAGHVFIVAMIVAFYLSLMIWNYRPLRYQLPLIYGFCGAAAVVLVMLWRSAPRRSEGATPWLFYLLILPVNYAVAMQLIGGITYTLGMYFDYRADWWQGLGVALLLSAAVGITIDLDRSGKLPEFRVLSRVLVVLLVGWVVGSGVYGIADWRERVQYTVRDNARDLAMAVGDNAVYSGPYGPTFALVTGGPAVIHMFGPEGGNPNLFDRFPVTHLLLDESNEQRAKEQIPGVMDESPHICTYHVGLEKVRVYAIGGKTANPVAGQYKPSVFELAAVMFTIGDTARAWYLGAQYLREHPGNITGNLMMADIAQKQHQWERQEYFLKKAVEFSPTNYNLNAALAMFYKNRYEMTAHAEYKTMGLKYFREAVRLAPTVSKIRLAMNELKDM